MNTATSALLVVLFVLASGLFSGSETGFYILSHRRVRAGSAEPRGLVHRLLQDEVGLLVTLLIANNLINQATTYAGADLLRPLAIPGGARELVLALLLTPLLFFFGELLPKDLFRRRPRALLAASAPVLYGARILLFPLAALLRAVTRVLQRSAGLDETELARVRGREEAVLDLLRERGGDRDRHVETLARNVLGLRSLRVDRVMIPWKRVKTLAAASSPTEAYGRVAECPFSRLPVTGPAGEVRGYVHQTEVLAAGPGDLLAHLRPMISLEPAMPLDRALARLRSSGQRAALVGDASAPLGLVTVKDLVEEISGELSRW